ncbi:MAG: Tm-1-like ATP-binding domain-containing protein [Clostridium fessum]
MESMIREGVISAVMDLSLARDDSGVFGDYGYSKGADNRLCAAAEMGIPALICPGGIDFACLRKRNFSKMRKIGDMYGIIEDLTHTRLYEIGNS